jgi:hypothetical protein
MGVPTSLNKLTLKQLIKFEQLKALPASNSDAIIRRADKQLACVTGLSMAEIENLPYWKHELYFKQLASLNADKPKVKVKKVIWVKGKRYKYFKSEKDLNANQYTAFKTYQENSIANIHKCGSIAYLRSPLFGKTRFKAEDCEQIANDLLDQKVSKVYGAVFFCMNELESLSLISQASLMIAEMEIQSHKKQMFKDLEALGVNTDGTISLIQSQVEMLLKKMNTSNGQR